MAVIRDNLPAIRALASARLGFDLTTWRLEDYLNLQSFACLWGLVPGSVTDEESPFNECAHAYLAAGRALLLQLNREPGADHKSIDALTSKIEVEMLADGASLNPAAIVTSRSTPTRLSGRTGAWLRFIRRPDDGGGRLCRAQHRCVEHMAQAERKPAAGKNRNVASLQIGKPLGQLDCRFTASRRLPFERRSTSSLGISYTCSPKRPSPSSLAFSAPVRRR
jgi:hypothetical protein